jgi:methylenetetrahydrofolate dehydrogenase (NADP+)/methenyltetrahydrofolate cyclohydrolase
MTLSDRSQLIDGRRIAGEIHTEVQAEVQKLVASGHPPHLVVVEAAGDPASEVYVERQRSRFSQLGIRYTHLNLDARVTTEEMEARLDELNEDPTVTGILVTLPLPPGIPAGRIVERIRPAKDVEGVTATHLGRLLGGNHRVGPCTALAVMTALESTGVPLKGKNAVVVGRSNIVGKPVGLLLLAERVTVTTCHTATRDLKDVTRRADILIAAAGQPQLVTSEMVREGTVVIDVGIHRLQDPPRTIGDVDFDSVAPRASWITPVPGGIGPITVAMLARNTVRCAQDLAR